MPQVCRVVAIGEVLWDVFGDSRRLGGAPLNFAAHAMRLGRQVLLVSGVGEDEPGRAALAAMQQAGLDTRFVRSVCRLPTGSARVHLGRNGQTAFRIERPAAYDSVCLSEVECSDIAAWSPDWLYHGTLFAHRGQAKRSLDVLSSALPGVRRFYDVNLRPDCFSPELVLGLLALADVVKLNEVEMQSVAPFAGLPKNRMASFSAAGAARFGWDTVAVTLGERGCAVWRNGEYAEAPGYKIRVVDAVGAGDGFAAALLHGLCCQWGAPAIADFANQLGSLIASRHGGMPDWSMDELRLPSQPFEPGPGDAPL